MFRQNTILKGILSKRLSSRRQSVFPHMDPAIEIWLKMIKSDVLFQTFIELLKIWQKEKLKTMDTIFVIDNLLNWISPVNRLSLS